MKYLAIVLCCFTAATLALENELYKEYQVRNELKYTTIH